MERQIIIQEITKEELLEAICTTVKNQINLLKGDISIKESEEELMNRKEVMSLLGISEVTIWDWQNKGKIKLYKIGSRNFYKRSEILAALTPKIY